MLLSLPPFFRFVLPRDVVVSVEGINITAPTNLLIRDSPYWTSRVAEHVARYAASPSTPIILEENDGGLNIMAYEFLVYVGFLQAEDRMQRALWANDGQVLPGFSRFAPAGLPVPSARTLDSVSRMAAFFGRGDLVMRVPDSIVDHPSSPPYERSQSEFIYAGTLQPFPGDNIAHFRDHVRTPTYYHPIDNDAVHGHGRSSLPQQSPLPPLSAIDTETEVTLTYLPDGRVVLPPMLSPLSPSFYGLDPDVQSPSNDLQYPPAPETLEEFGHSGPPTFDSGPWWPSQQRSEQGQTNESSGNGIGTGSGSETDMHDRSSRSPRSSRLPGRFLGERAAERRHHPYRRNSRLRRSSSRGTQTMEEASMNEAHRL